MWIKLERNGRKIVTGGLKISTKYNNVNNANLQKIEYYTNQKKKFMFQHKIIVLTF